jgi:hypothetical protein
MNIAEAEKCIPLDVENVLNALPLSVKVVCTVGVSLFLSDCEQQGLLFDPISLDCIIRSLVPVLVSVACF